MQTFIYLIARFLTLKYEADLLSTIFNIISYLLTQL